MPTLAVERRMRLFHLSLRVIMLRNSSWVIFELGAFRKVIRVICEIGTGFMPPGTFSITRSPRWGMASGVPGGVVCFSSAVVRVGILSMVAW